MRKLHNGGKGITIVEMLAILGVITVLAGMWFFASTEAVTTAKATMIITNLRMMTKAAQMWYMDHAELVDELGRIKWDTDKSKNTGEFADSTGNNAVIRAQDLYAYIDIGGLKLVKTSKRAERSWFDNKNTFYDLYDENGGKYIADWISADGSTNSDYPRLWIITYTMPTNDPALKKKLAAQAVSSGLFFKALEQHGYYVYSYEQAKNAQTISMVAMDFGNEGRGLKQ